MGVEEEYLLIGADDVPVSVADLAVERSAPPPDPAVPGGDVGTEFTQQQIESGTPPCRDLSDLEREVRAGRRRTADAAAEAGARVAALGTSPLEVTSTITPAPRFLAMAEVYGLTAREQLTCGCHVHVEVSDDEEGVAVLDRIGPWLAPLTALSANSPFWAGTDSSYASYRSRVWNRWPTAGPVGRFGSAAAYHALVQDLLASGTILDTAMTYFDARLSARYPTVEIRVADVCLRAEDAVLVAALARGLVETAARDAAAGVAPPPVRVEQLRVASWRAARSGLTGDLVSPTEQRAAPAADVLGELVKHVAPALADAGDLALVEDGIDRVLRDGTGAQVQRGWARERGLGAVVGRAVAATLE